MYTSKVTVYRSESFTVTSYGNGAGYAVDDHVMKASFFFQDEDSVEVIDHALDGDTDSELAEYVVHFDPTDDEQAEYFATYWEEVED